MYVHICVYSMYSYIYMQACREKCMYKHLCVSYVCMELCIYVLICVCMSVFVYL